MSISSRRLDAAHQTGVDLPVTCASGHNFVGGHVKLGSALSQPNHANRDGGNAWFRLAASASECDCAVRGDDQLRHV